MSAGCRRPFIRILVGAGLVIASLSPVAQTPPSAAAAADSADDAASFPEELRRDYRAAFPMVPEREVLSRVQQLNVIADVGEEFAKDPSFAGTWTDFRTNEHFLMATDATTLERMALSAHRKQSDIVDQSRIVEITYAELFELR